MIHIKVLGPGCRNCEKLVTVAKNTISQSGVDAVVEKVSDYAEIMQYDILATPGLVINEKLVSAGRIPSETEVTGWLTNALSTA